MNPNKVSWLVLALLVMSAAGTAASLVYQSSQLENITKMVADLSERLDVLTEQPYRVASSPDGKFVMYGSGTCSKDYSVAEPRKVEEGGISYDVYDVRRPVGPNEADVGNVAIQSRKQYQAKPLVEPYRPAFETPDMVVWAVFTDLPDKHCLLSVEGK